MNMISKKQISGKGFFLKILCITLIIMVLIFALNLACGEEVAISVTYRYLQNAYSSNEISIDDILCQKTICTRCYGLISYISKYETFCFFDNGIFVHCRFTGAFPFIMISHSETMMNSLHGLELN